MNMIQIRKAEGKNPLLGVNLSSCTIFAVELVVGGVKATVVALALRGLIKCANLPLSVSVSYHQWKMWYLERPDILLMNNRWKGASAGRGSVPCTTQEST